MTTRAPQRALVVRRELALAAARLRAAVSGATCNLWTMGHADARLSTSLPGGVALVIPAWNEEASIGAVLSEVPPSAVQPRATFVVVGVSTDRTAEIVRTRGAQAIRTERSGYGRACRAGAEAALDAEAEVLAFLDGDYSDPPAYLPALLQPVLSGRADLVLGSRQVMAQPGALPVHARLGNRAVLLALHCLIGFRLQDLPSFKVIRAEAFRALDMGEMTYGWTIEMIVKAARLGFRIEEVPIAYRARLGGQSKVSGTLNGTIGAAWKLGTCALRYARWSPTRMPTSSPESLVGPPRGAR